MKAKPKGGKYRNLYAYRGSIWFEREVRGRRFRVDLETAAWETAAARRDEYEKRKGVAKVRARAGYVPTLAEFAQRYLDEDTAHLAPTTRRAHKALLGEDGRLLPVLGGKRLDEITPAMLREWWAAEIEKPRAPKPRAEGEERKPEEEPKPLATQTGRHYVNALAAVYGYAKDLGILDPEESPVPGFREQLRRRARTKRGRAAAVAGRHVQPIEGVEELGRLVGAARQEGPAPLVLVLLLLDAGLRLGEALGLRWGAVQWGENENDPRRALLIDQSRPTHGEGLEATKSGRGRRVALSRRLWRTLRVFYTDRFEPGPASLVLESIDPDNFRAREWRRICIAAGIGHRAMKDLRDTFASQLFSLGVQLGYVSAQLGHSEVTTTARHYARWVGGDAYRAPLPLRRGELPADLLARLAPEKSPQTPHKAPEAASDAA